MIKRIPFTRQEAAILLDAYLKVVSGKLSRTASVRECSSKLRRMAVNAGEDIDDFYRNISGISFQMASMESAYHGRTIMKPATRLFSETVNLFKTDYREYRKLLHEANNMIEKNQNNESALMNWLFKSKKITYEQLSELHMALVEIEQQAQKAGLINSSIYDSLAPYTIERIRANIERNGTFRIAYKGQWETILSALNYLFQYSNRISTETVVDQIQDETLIELIPTKTVSQKSESSLDTASFTTILVDHFPKGYRLGSVLDMKKLRRFYENLTGSELTVITKLYSKSFQNVFLIIIFIMLVC